MILAGYDGTVAEWTADIGNDPGGKSKERRPGGRRDPCHQDITRSHLSELIRSLNDPRRAGDTTRAGGDSFQYITFELVGTGWHPRAPVNPQEASTTFERQGHWRRESAFALPGCTPLSQDCMIVRW